MDGVDALNNILIIGMTNRIDMLDEAILRPGRLELHLEIGLPDEGGRLQIFDIHTRQMKKNNLLHTDVDLQKLAAISNNYTGAEIEAVCRSASSFALFKQEELDALAKAPTPSQKNKNKFEEKKVCMQDFLNAIAEIKPAFGIDDKSLESSIRAGILPYGDRFNKLQAICNDFVQSIRNASSATPLLTVLLEGENGSGKTALAAKIALESKFPYVKMISPEQFVGFTEFAKVQAIAKVFNDAYRSPLSLIVLDDIERLIEFIHIGPRFSNSILQSLLVLIKKRPPADKKLLVIGTTSMKRILQDLEVVDSFNTTLSVPMVSMEDEIASILGNFNCGGDQRTIKKIAEDFASFYPTDELNQGGVPIKTIMLAIELAIERGGNGQVSRGIFMECLRSIHK